MGNSRQQGVMATDVFIRQDAVRPGDVVLSLGMDAKTSRRIAEISGSKFSHAAIVVGSDKWFEADECGVGYSMASLEGGWLQGPRTFVRLLAVPESTDAVLLRHPALADRPVDEVEALIEKTVAKWDGFDYSDYRRLFGTLRVSGKPNWLVDWTLRVKQWWEGRAKDGLFCSEVVARTFEELKTQPGYEDVSLFGAARPAHWVHPGHLYASRLAPVTGAIVRAKQLPAGMTIQRDEPIGLGRRWLTEHAVSERAFEKMRVGWQGLIEDMQRQALDASRLNHARLEHELRECLDCVLPPESAELRDRVNRHLVLLAESSNRSERHMKSVGTAESLKAHAAYVDLFIDAKLTILEAVKHACQYYKLDWDADKFDADAARYEAVRRECHAGVNALGLDLARIRGTSNSRTTDELV